MDVPFISSGALSAAQYALVRNVEMSASAQEADQHLISQVRSLRERLSRPGISPAQRMEHLVILLYCFTTSESSLSSNDFEFAFPHAIALAEAGKTLAQRRIGYLFCMIIMPSEHELQLMLVNTIRKDLDSHEVGRMSLALEFLVQCPNVDVIPAVQTTLRSLLVHPSPIIRRKVLLSVRSLGSIDLSLLHSLGPELPKRVRDSDDGVVGAAVSLCVSLHNHDLLDDAARLGIRRALIHFTKSVNDSSTARLVLLKILRYYLSTKPTSEEFALVASLLQHTRSSNTEAVRYACYSVIQHASIESIDSLSMPLEELIAPIRQGILSYDANSLYFSILCLSCIDPCLWAGISANRPAKFDQLEVERIIQLLSSADSSIRSMTARILMKVDSSIVNTYFSQQLDGLTTETPLSIDATLVSLLDLGQIMACGDGGQYARIIWQVLSVPESRMVQAEVRGLYRNSVECVLTHLRDSGEDYTLDATSTLATLFSDSEKQVNQSFIVIISALICEHAHQISVPPPLLLERFAKEMHMHSLSVGDAMLLAMICLSAECEHVPMVVKDSVKKLKESSGKHIEKRCSQFLDFTENTVRLRSIVVNAQHSLPRIATALELDQRNAPIQSQQESTPEVQLPPPRSPLASSSRLRYDAYEAPSAGTSVRPSRSQSTTHLSKALSPTGDRMVPHQRWDHSPRQIGAGELVLAVQMDISSSDEYGRPRIPSQSQPILYDLLQGPQEDLISLDSPFVSRPYSRTEESLREVSDTDRPARGFSESWDALTQFSARGWCEAPLNSVMQQLRSLKGRVSEFPKDIPPFEGELKILMDAFPESKGSVTLRLRDNGSEEDGGCLWRLRSDDEELLLLIKRLLA